MQSGGNGEREATIHRGCNRIATPSCAQASRPIPIADSLLEIENWLYVATVPRCSTPVPNLCYGGISSEFVLPATSMGHEHWRKTMCRLIPFLLALALL